MEETTPQEQPAELVQPSVPEPEKPFNLQTLLEGVNSEVLKALSIQAYKDYKEYKNWKKQFSSLRFNTGGDKRRWIMNRMLQILIEWKRGTKS